MTNNELTDLRKAAEMALEALAWGQVDDAKEALQVALSKPKREWVGLTDEEYDELMLSGDWGGSLIQAVEAKLKEKNT